MLRVVDGLEVLLDVGLLVLEVLLEVDERADPLLLDELVVAGELPSDQLLGVLGREVVVLVDQRLADVLSLQHVLGLELDREVGRRGLESVDAIDLYDFDGALRQLVELVEDLDVVACVWAEVPVKDLGMLE